MREILFRGKRIDNGLWIKGDLVHVQTVNGAIIKIHSKLCMADVIPETVGQFTGLTDKDKNKIFEGDTCIQEDGTLEGYVRFDHGWAIDYGSHSHDMPQYFYCNHLKITGNIHDR